MSNLKQETISQEKLQAALEYIKLGWHVLPLWQVEDGACACGKSGCSSVGKHPISHLVPHGQNSAATDEQTVTNWWTRYPDANIGVYLAPSNLCAVDIDVRHGGDYTMEELEGIHGKTDSDVLQLTGGGGEHRVFKLPEGVKLPGTLGKGIDLKSNGYIVVEPSNHASGGVYEWEASSNPLEGCEPSDLPEWILNIANASSSSPVEAGGEPINFGMTSDQYEDAKAALPFIPADERDMWTKVGMALHSTNDGRAYDLWCQWSATSDKYDHKDQFRVWRSFKHKGLSGYDLATVFYLAQENGWVNVKKSVKSPVAELIVEDDFISDVEEAVNDTDFPEHLLIPPVPMLGAVASWMSSYSREPQPQITMQGVIALASVLCGRIYESEQSNTSSLYLMILGDTGVGKNYVISAINDFLDETSLSKLLSGSGNTSSGAVYGALFDSPCHIQIIDEFGKQLQTARKQTNGQMAEAFSTLVEAYSRTTGLMLAKNYSTMGLSKEQRKAKDKNIVYYPAITLLGLATPRQVYSNLTTDDIEDGFLNRLVVVDVTLPQAELRKTRKQKVPDYVKDWAESIRRFNNDSPTDLTGLDTDYDMRPMPRLVRFSDEADDLFYKNELGLRERASNGEFVIPEMTKRWNENAMRMATMLAVCLDPINPVITEELAQWSIDYVEYYGTQFMLNISTKVADSEFHRLYLAVKDVVEKAGKKGLTEREIGRKSSLFAQTAPHQRDQVLTALSREGYVQQIKFKPKSGRGAGRSAWVAEAYIDENILAGLASQ